MKSFLIFLLLVSTSLAYIDYEYDEVCSIIGGDAGDCVPLEECEPLLNILKNRPILKKSLGVLVNLTCEFSLTEPKVCCPFEKDTDLESSEFENITPKVVESKAKPHSNTTSPPSRPPPFHNPTFRDHRNFGKIPGFRKCSVSLSSYLRNAIRGNQTFRGQFPWVALLGYKDTISEKTVFRCSGTVITKRHILTSAQCTDLESYGKPIVVRLGEHDLLQNPDCTNAAELGCSQVQDFKIKKIVVHEGFNFTTGKRFLQFENDIAVIALQDELTFDIYTQPVCLPFITDYLLISFPKRLESVSASYLAGWESLETTSQTSPKRALMKLSVTPIKSNSVCKAHYYPLSVITDTQICAGNDFPTDCCSNPGSALMISHRERTIEKYFQVGITSYVPFHLRENPIPGIYTRVTSHLEFILNALD